jgi:hypothetical protein
MQPGHLEFTKYSEINLTPKRVALLLKTLVKYSEKRDNLVVRRSGEQQRQSTSNKRAMISDVNPRCRHISAGDNKPFWSVSSVRYCWKICEKDSALNQFSAVT